MPKQAPQHEPDVGNPTPKGWTNVRQSGRRRPSFATTARLQHEIGNDKPIDGGRHRLLTANLRARGLTTRADAETKKRIQSKPRNRGDDCTPQAQGSNLSLPTKQPGNLIPYLNAPQQQPNIHIHPVLSMQVSPRPALTFN